MRSRSLSCLRAVVVALLLVPMLLVTSLTSAGLQVGAAEPDLVTQQIWPRQSGEVWATLRDATEQGTAWRQLGFDDSSWPTTTMRDYTKHGGVPNDGRGHYYRKEFELTDVWKIQAIQAELFYDDAAVLFLNGQEVYRTIRNNLPTDPELGIIQTIPYGGAEFNYIGIPSDSNYCEQGCGADTSVPPIPVDLLVEGTNVWGIMAWTTPNSDLGVDLALSLTIDRNAVPPGPQFDDIAPQSAQLADAISLQLSATNEGSPIVWEAANLPDGLAIDAGTGLISGAPTVLGAFTTTITATDDVGTNQIDIDWSIANAPPVLTSPGPQQTSSFTPVSLQLDASDPDGGTIVWDVQGLPAGITADADGLITGSSSAEGAYTIDVSATDDEGDTVAVQFPWQIAEPPITIDQPGDQETAWAAAVALTLTASDPGGGDVTLSLEGLPDGLSFDAETNEVTGTPAAVGTWTVIISGSGPSGNSIISFDWTVPNEVPTVSAPVAPLTVAQLPNAGATATASDPDGGDVTLTAAGQPPGIEFDPDTGAFSGLATADGTFTVTITATDDEGAEGSDTFDWIVQEAFAKPIRINEVMASNDVALEDEDGDTPDWIELHNPTPIDLDLAGWTLQDAATTWAIPNVTIPAGGYRLVFASDKDRTDPDGELHTNFKLSKEGDLVILADADGIIIDNVGDEGYPRQLADVSYGVGADGTFGYMDAYTPGQTNLALGDDFVPVLRPFSDRIFNEGDAVLKQIDGFDPDGDDLTYGLFPAPDGVTLALATGEVGGTAATAGVYETMISVTDTDGRSADQAVNWMVIPPPVGQNALVLNEYNAVSGSSELLGGHDPAFPVDELGNGGDWYEFMVMEDGLDIRGWTIELWDRDNDDELLVNSASLVFADRPELVNLPKGTLITIAEDQPDDLSFNPIAMDFHMNLQSNDELDGGWITPESQESFNSSRSDQTVIIRNADGINVSPAVGETEAWDDANGGVGGGEVFALCVDPTDAHVDPVTDYMDNGLFSSFGALNTCPMINDPDDLEDDTTFEQDPLVQFDWQPRQMTVDVTCLNGDGRLDVYVAARNQEPEEIILNVGQLLRSATSDGFSNHIFTITGRPDGELDVTFVGDGNGGEDQTETVNIACDPPPPEVEILVSCLAGNGRIDAVINSGDVFATYRVDFGPLYRTRSVAPGVETKMTVTGRGDGPIDMIVTRNADVVHAETVFVDCDPDIEVVVAVSCLAGNGRIDATITNINDAAASYAVAVGTLLPRVRAIDPGVAKMVSVTGRADGDWLVVVERNGGQVHEEVATVDCDPNVEISVASSCLAGNGRIDVLIANDTGSTAIYEAMIGNLMRVRTVGDGESSIATVTGRPDKDFTVEVMRDGEVIHTETVTIACDEL